MEVIYVVLVGLLILTTIACVVISVALLWTYRQIGDVSALQNRLRATENELEGLSEAFRLYKARTAVRATREKQQQQQPPEDVDSLIDKIDMVYKG